MRSCFRVDLKKGFTVDRVVSAKVVPLGYSPVEWMVDLTVSAADRPRLAALTRVAAAAKPLADELAVVVDGKLQSVLSMRKPLTDGRVEFGGYPLTASTARVLALRLVAG